MKCNIIQIFCLLILTFFLLIQCSDQQHSIQTDDIINIDITKTNKGDIVGQINPISIVQLQTNDSCLIGSINKILIRNNSILITDHFLNTIYIFDMHGNFVNKFGRVGKGPGEFLRIDDFDVSPNDSQIVVLDNLQRKIITFKFDGGFESEERFTGDFFPRFFGFIGNNMAFETGSSSKNDSCYRVIITDKSIKIISSLIKDKNEDGMTIGNLTHFQKYEKYLNYIPPMYTSIFTIKSESISEKRFDFGKFNLTTDFKNKKMDPGSFAETINTGNFVYYFNALESDSFYFYNFFVNKTRYSGIYNKVMRSNQLYKDKDKELDLVPLTVYNNTFVSYIESENNEKIKLINNILNKNIIPKVNSNPILVFIKYKKQ